MKNPAMIYRRLSACAVLALLCTTADAAVVSTVGGTIADGQSIVIGGSGFGASGPNVVVFDDFEGGTSGSAIKTGNGSAKFGRWSGRDSSGSSYYGNTAAVSGTKAFSSNFSVHYANWIQADLPANTRALFVSWWLYLPAGNNYPGEGGSEGINWKQMWVQGSSTADDDLVIPTLLGDDTWLVNGNDKDPGYSRYTDLGFDKGRWKRVWVWMKGSTGSSSRDGEFKLWTLDANGVTTRVNDAGVNNLKASGVWEKVRPNGYGRQTSNSVVSYDDIYIASGTNAQARVEIGDSATYAASKKLTILTPTSWANGSISATVNTGPFKSGDSAYLFVIDGNGNASNGFPITIGGTRSGAVPPEPPALTVQ